MKVSTIILLKVVLLGLFCMGLRPNPLLGNDQSNAILTLLTQMESSYARVEDYAAAFLKQERVDGKLLPEETMLLKFQKPLKVYMKWTKDPHREREALYVEGKDDNKVIVHEGGIMGFVTLSLDPRGSISMKDSRHPITDIGFGHLIKMLRQDIQAAVENGELEIIRMGEELFHNRPSVVVEARSTPRGERNYYASRMVLHVDKELLLPFGSALYDDKDQLFERYVYTDVRLNIGFTPMDFSRENAAYHF
jgi:outer membrane lipoprotein-sorting protein